jgi:hypothetical protein
LSTNVKRILAAILFTCFASFAGCGLSSDSHHNDNGAFARIDEKLETQFDLYAQARETLIDRVVEQNGVVQREEWERWLAPEPEDALDEKEMAKITERRQQTIEDSRMDAMAASPLDLDLIRNDDIKLEQYCRAFPKGALLHIHPSGRATSPFTAPCMPENWGLSTTCGMP